MYNNHAKQYISVECGVWSVKCEMWSVKKPDQSLI